MSKEIIEKLFESLYSLTDLRAILRETSPQHDLTDEQLEEVKSKLNEVRENIDFIEEEIKSD